MKAKRKLIGAGTFTKAYKLPNDDKVHLVSTCMIKECMALDWFPNSSLFPVVEYSSIEGYDYQMKDYSDGCYTFKMRDLFPQDRQFIRELKEIEKLQDFSNPENNYKVLYNLFSTMISSSYYGGVMIEALNACANCGSDIFLEISPRNLRCSGGNVVLLDVFFVHSKLVEINKEKYTKRRGY